jgi:hypothetical protein
MTENGRDHEERNLLLYFLKLTPVNLSGKTKVIRNYISRRTEYRNGLLTQSPLMTERQHKIIRHYQNMKRKIRNELLHQKHRIQQRKTKMTTYAIA